MSALKFGVTLHNAKIDGVEKGPNSNKGKTWVLDCARNMAHFQIEPPEEGTDLEESAYGQ